MSMQFSFIEPIDRALLGATISGQSGPNGNEGVLCIPQSPSITGTVLSDCLVSYPTPSREAVVVFYSPSRLGKERKDIEKKRY